LRLLFSYVLGSRLGLRWRAIQEIQHILASGFASPTVKINALTYLQQIEARFKDEELKTSQLLGLNTYKILAQQKKIEDFKQLLTNSCHKSKAFWQELLQKKPNVNNLQGLGFQIADLSGKIHESMVAGETEEAKRVSAKIEVVSNSVSADQWFGKENRLKNIEVGNPCILIASCGNEDAGLIKTANIHASNLLFYSKQELQGQSLDVILPGVFRLYHNK